VQSKKGEGSIFTLRIPLKSTDGPVREQPDLEIHQPGGKNSGDVQRILVVEDDFDSSEVARVYLGAIYDVVIVDSGEKAMDEIKKAQFDLILLDISLGPGMDGVKTLKSIRKNSSFRSVPVIALTAHALRGDADYYLSQGFSAYMPKPYKKKDLLSVVANYVNDNETEGG
jgi:CheY-like chemotaxis protein